MAVTYETYISTTKLGRPIGRTLGFAARPHVWKIREDGSSQPIPFGEFYGQTAEEAEARAENALQDWKRKLGIV